MRQNSFNILGAIFCLFCASVYLTAQNPQQIDEEKPILLSPKEFAARIIKKQKVQIERSLINTYFHAKGQIIFMITVDKNGKLEQYQKISGMEIFQKQFEKAVQSFEFKPLVRRGKKKRFTGIYVFLPSCENCITFVEDEYSAVGRKLKDYAVKQVLPKFPPSCRCVGKIILMIKLNEKGEIEKISEAQKGHPLLIAVSIRAVKEWKFKPFEMNGKAKKYYGFISFDFENGETTLN